MRITAPSVALIASLICEILAPAWASAQLSLEERQRFVTIVKKLESDPLDPNLRHDRVWAVQWLINVPDISVSACLGVIGGVSDKSFPQASEIIVQYTVAMAAFEIENPTTKDDQTSKQVAGVKSALAAYQAIRAAKPSAQSPELEKLLSFQRQGKLRDAVQTAYQRCTAKGANSQIQLLSPVESVQWDKIWDEPEIAVIYANRSSITGSKKLRSIATRTVYQNPLPDGNIAERIRVEEFDCSHHRSRIRRVIVSTNDGQPSQTIEWAPGKSPWRSHEPDSLGAQKYSIACAPTE
jgi:hypothetical protein